jgi:hypothetical protein
MDDDLYTSQISIGVSKTVDMVQCNFTGKPYRQEPILWFLIFPIHFRHFNIPIKVTFAAQKINWLIEQLWY